MSPSLLSDVLFYSRGQADNAIRLVPIASYTLTTREELTRYGCMPGIYLAIGHFLVGLIRFVELVNVLWHFSASTIIESNRIESLLISAGARQWSSSAVAGLFVTCACAWMGVWDQRSSNQEKGTLEESVGGLTFSLVRGLVLSSFRFDLYLVLLFSSLLL